MIYYDKDKNELHVENMTILWAGPDPAIYHDGDKHKSVIMHNILIGIKPETIKGAWDVTKWLSGYIFGAWKSAVKAKLSKT